MMNVKPRTFVSMIGYWLEKIPCILRRVTAQWAWVGANWPMSWEVRIRKSGSEDQSNVFELQGIKFAVPNIGQSKFTVLVENVNQNYQNHECISPTIDLHTWKELYVPIIEHCQAYGMHSFISDRALEAVEYGDVDRLRQILSDLKMGRNNKMLPIWGIGECTFNFDASKY
jgi:hypothetical protein